MHPVWHIFVDRKVRKWSGIFKCHLDLQGLRSTFPSYGGQKAANGRQEVEDGLTELASSSQRKPRITLAYGACMITMPSAGRVQITSVT
jgi:hypothetical protein